MLCILTGMKSNKLVITHVIINITSLIPCILQRTICHANFLLHLQNWYQPHPSHIKLSQLQRTGEPDEFAKSISACPSSPVDAQCGHSVITKKAKYGLLIEGAAYSALQDDGETPD